MNSLINIINPSAMVFDKNIAPTKKVEQIARVCYKSEDKIGDMTDCKMIEALLKNDHTAMIEHASLCIAVRKDFYFYMMDMVKVLEEYGFVNRNDNKKTYKSYLRFSCIKSYLISGNMRAWREFFQATIEMIRGFHNVPFPAELFEAIENTEYGIFLTELDPSTVSGINIKAFSYKRPCSIMILRQYLDDFDEYLTDQEKLIHTDVSAKFICDRGVTHEIVRHRDASFAQESTRYCNYSNDKFGKQLTVIRPCFFVNNDVAMNMWMKSMEEAAEAYFALINIGGCTPQEARDVLPNSIKTEITMTANLREWIHFFNLRYFGTTGTPHPQMKEVAEIVYNEMKSLYPILDKEK